MNLTALSAADPVMATLITKEYTRNNHAINLIASENYPHPAIFEAVGSLLSTKYAEGYPGKRYYAGCSVVDEIEQLAIDRCKQLFGAEYANVQPHAGSQANMAVYLALAKPGDCILGMKLSAGGHLTHGHSVNFSGKIFKFVQYGVSRETELFDYDELQSLARLHAPRIIVVGASAYSRVIDYNRCAAIAKEVGAYLVVDMAHIAGLIAAGVHPSPVPFADVVTSTTQKTLQGGRGGFILYKKNLGSAIDKAIIPGIQGGPFMHEIAAKGVCFYRAMQPEFIGYQQRVLANAALMAEFFKERGYRLVSGGTENHLFILDLSKRGISGFDAEALLERCGIVTSRSCIPFDTAAPGVGSGIRIGTPAMTSRGMGAMEARECAQLVHEILEHREDEAQLALLRGRVAVCAEKMPLGF